MERFLELGGEGTLELGCGDTAEDFWNTEFTDTADTAEER